MGRGGNSNGNDGYSLMKGQGHTVPLAFPSLPLPPSATPKASNPRGVLIVIMVGMEVRRLSSRFSCLCIGRDSQGVMYFNTFRYCTPFTRSALVSEKDTCSCFVHFIPFNFTHLNTTILQM